MRVKIKRLDKSLPLPAYSTAGSVCFDLYSRIKMNIKPHTLALIPTNMIIKVPKGYMLHVLARSSTPKKGLLIPHGMGIIDQDYHGPNDEIFFQVLNYTSRNLLITRGERIAQGYIIAIQKVSFKEDLELKKKNRGGFGSTG